jgi:hypothetical protein
LIIFGLQVMAIIFLVLAPLAFLVIPTLANDMSAYV